MFERVAGQRQVIFSWSPPAVTQRNGVITSYTLSCSPSPSSLPLSPSQSGQLNVTGFSPNTPYSCSVVATNSQGSGPPETRNLTTQQDCNYSLYNIVEFEHIFHLHRYILPTSIGWTSKYLQGSTGKFSLYKSMHTVEPLNNGHIGMDDLGLSQLFFYYSTLNF